MASFGLGETCAARAMVPASAGRLAFGADAASTPVVGVLDVRVEVDVRLIVIEEAPGGVVSGIDPGWHLACKFLSMVLRPGLAVRLGHHQRTAGGVGVIAWRSDGEVLTRTAIGLGSRHRGAEVGSRLFRHRRGRRRGRRCRRRRDYVRGHDQDPVHATRLPRVHAALHLGNGLQILRRFVGHEGRDARVDIEHHRVHGGLVRVRHESI
mmetsp:Transcript_12367/g.32876  ORF Transcript_12367/g.32876 Transcript_12367/m.32876 type:complete len:209 (+) Transcript_12367:772-1398(+)